MNFSLMKNIINITLVVFLLSFCSCNDYLEKMPDDRTIIDSPEKIGELLTFAYPNQNHQMFCYAMSDNATDKGKSGRKNEINSDAYNWVDFRMTTQDTPDSYWTGCYSAIKQANHALDAIEHYKVNGQLSTEVRPFYGEALIARAYCHFMLVNLWGKSYNPETAKDDLGIPYVTEPEVNVMTKYRRASVADVYDNLEKDIVEGLKYIDDNAYTNKTLRWNFKAAHTFAARYYSVKGDFDKVLEHTNKVLSSNVAESLRDLTGKYDRMDINEAVTEWGKTDENANLLVTPQYSKWFFYFHGAFQYAMSNEFYNYVFRKSFVGGDWIWKLRGADPDILLAKWGYHRENSGLNSDIGYYMIMNVLVDIEEALFLRMEANTMLNDFTAVRTDMDAYLSKRLKTYDFETHKVEFAKMEKEYKESIEYNLKPFYALDATQRVYMNCLYDLRRKEFYYTGMRWFDHKRFNTRVRHYFANGEVAYLQKDDARRQLQIPMNAQSQGIVANPR